MQRNRWLRVLAAVGAAALLATACGGDDDAVTDPTATGTETPTDDMTAEPTATETALETGANVDGTLKIGTVLPQTGDLAVLGPAMIEAVKLAVSQINEAGGVLDTNVELAEGDSGTNEDVANDTVDRLVQSENVDALIGAASSRVTLSIIDKVTGAGIVECSPSNTGSSLTTHETDVPGFYFRTAPPDNLQGPALADVILGDGHANVAIVALNDEYGQGFAGFLEESLTAGGATIVANVAYDPAGADFSADVQTVVDASPDAVALISFPETGTPIIQGLLEGGIAADQMYTADGMQDNSVIESVAPGDPAALNGMKGTAPSSQGSEAFQTAFTEFAPPDTPQIFSAHAYDCAIIISLAAQEAGSDDPTVFHNNMVGITRDGEACIDFASCKEVIDAGGDPDYDGASGPGEWVDEGEPAAGTYEVWEFRDGEVATLDTVDVG
ncbi:MAG: ABC transporter substrate-binding protein [Actinobacteria bacterium]|nr:ABC transporter substrate-binding protein [Actinomycetota bacterium]